MLRITAGEHRGRRLKVPRVASTRPLIEKARQGVLDHLRDTVPDAMVWDVFAGSGILGLECLSRGAKRVIAIERHPRAAAQLRENVELLGYDDRHEILREDARQFLEREPEPPVPDLIFFDPPYAAFRGGGREAVWELFCTLSQRLRPGGCSVVHTPRGILSEAERGRLPGIVQRDYGTASLYWWHCAGDDAGE